MESLDELSKTSNGKPGFFKYVFNFDQDSKGELLNIIQYTVLALIPIVILNKFMQKYIPEADDEKGSLEITAEVVIQLLVIFLGIFFIHRIITYVPTYSGEKYPDWTVIHAILPLTLILTALQTKLGEKVSILFDRLMELWNGPKNTKKNGKNGNVKVSQPISQNQAAMNQSLGGSTSINSLPPAQTTQTQSLPDYNQMYQQDSTPLIGASNPGSDMTEPMAANSGMGGFGSAFGW